MVDLLVVFHRSFCNFVIGFSCRHFFWKSLQVSKPFESSFLFPCIFIILCCVLHFFVQTGVFYSSFASNDLSKEASLKSVDCLCFLFSMFTELWVVYTKLDVINILNMLRSIDSEIFLAHSAFLFMWRASQSNNCFLLLIFSDTTLSSCAIKRNQWWPYQHLLTLIFKFNQLFSVKYDGL